IMKKTLALLALAALAATQPAAAQTTVRVGWCAKTITSAAAPYAIATKMGWFVKAVATKDVDYSVPSIEPLAIIRPQGVKALNFYTAYQGNIYGIMVPEDSPVKTFTDLKGKTIGVTSMASAGVIIARAIAKTEGMNPDTDIKVVVA